MRDFRKIAEGLYRDLAEIFEAQGVDRSSDGAEWWDDRVTSGVAHLNDAAEAFGDEGFGYAEAHPSGEERA